MLIIQLKQCLSCIIIYYYFVVILILAKLANNKTLSITKPSSHYCLDEIKKPICSAIRWFFKFNFCGYVDVSHYNAFIFIQNSIKSQRATCIMSLLLLLWIFLWSVRSSPYMKTFDFNWMIFCYKNKNIKQWMMGLEKS